ncbi:GNAT family N-acetyltransferase [Pelagovum pacificum]|uniref:GNAT family N-acetyltransferase n=1 Tax=Pelagovum pacificum TaxID=2588711 RepID=A0A5C5GJQ9_9RHOB|nr:GNAT family N-acetyltransferase [Pelagovum pacificum]QQA45045.1 GNAT family N-acetyltransferase [Pelagovum pacificum]TNY34414.1 GNAT family N-acetyltransferase [Pelagovum pacificum]
MQADALSRLIDATWPAAGVTDVGGWRIRRGGGGGSRVSAATALVPGDVGDLSVAEEAMRDLGQVPLFMVRDGEAALDRALADCGYGITDPTAFYSAPVAEIAGEAEAILSWPPVAVQREIWAAGGIGPSRLDIMLRAAEPRVSLLARLGDEPAGTVHLSLADGAAMIHALETAAAHRRKGIGRLLCVASANWARDEGADRLALLVTRANAGGNALYRSLGFAEDGGYHYRKHPDGLDQ